MDYDRQLHFHAYDGGHVGMCNVLMSVELALVAGMLTQRLPFIYAQQPIFNSDKKLYLDDLFDVDGAVFRREPLEPKGRVLPDHLQYACITNGRPPSTDFLCGRTKVVDLRDYWDAERISTADCKTLGFYSYLFCLTPDEKRSADDLIRLFVRPKAKYRQHAERIVRDLRSSAGRFQSIHVRRGDYLKAWYAPAGARMTVRDYLQVLVEHFSKDVPLLIHTDEEDESFFDDVKRMFRDVRFVDKELGKHYQDRAEMGLVSLLVASQSDEFAGTMYSTFSEVIRRYRQQNGMSERFIYLFSQHESVRLTKGRILEPRVGENRWNRVEMGEQLHCMNFWWREWYEHAPDSGLPTNWRKGP